MEEKNSPPLWTIDLEGKQRLPNGVVVDWNRGILQQLEDIGTCYLEWIDHPKLGRCRMFDNELLESLSYTYWWMVGLLYIPWAILEFQKGYFKDGLDFIPLVFYFCSGGLFWTFFEYTCHRFAFHWEPHTPKLNKTHFVGHGMHHVTPADPYRLVFPPAISFPLGLLFRVLYYSILPMGASAGFFAGFLVGYAWYESTHYLSHHCPVGAYLQNRFKFHSAHHFNPAKKDALYGVTSQLWDMVFNTL